MAKIYKQNSFNPSNLISLGATFARQNGQPLNKDEVWTDLDALKKFAKTDTAYAGQIFSYINETAGTVTNYTVLPNGDLQEIGAVNLPDYVKFTDYASANKSGVGFVASSFAEKNTTGGIILNTVNHRFTIRRAQNADIDARVANDYLDGGVQGGNSTFPICPSNLDYAVKSVVTKPLIELTDEEKTSSCNWLGAFKEIVPERALDHVFAIDAEGNKKWALVDAGNGLALLKNGNLIVSGASEKQITTRTNKPLMAKDIDFAVTEVLTNYKGTEWTDDDKERVCATIGAVKRYKGGTENIIYGAYWSGESVNFGFDEAPTAVSFPRRTAKGGLRVAIDETDKYVDELAVPKTYVDNGFVAKPTDTSGFNRLLGFDVLKNNLLFNVQYPNYSYDSAGARARTGIPYISAGQISCAIPTSDYSTANKKYVDDNFLSLSGGTITSDLNIQGNLTVKGSVTRENTTTSLVENAITVVNHNGTSTLTQKVGYVIREDASSAYGILYDPANDNVRLGKGTYNSTDGFVFTAGEDYPIALRDDSISNGVLLQWDNQKSKLVSSGKSVDDFVTKPTTGNSVPYFDSNFNNGFILINEKVDGSEAPQAFRIGRYSEGGTFPVGTPTSDYHAANKKYVADNFVAKVNNSSNNYRLYAAGPNSSGDAGFYATYTPIPGEIPIFGGSSITGINETTATIGVATPVNPYAAANKKYVDELAPGVLTQEQIDLLP